MFTFCVKCGKAWTTSTGHPNHTGSFLEFPGVGICIILSASKFEGTQSIFQGELLSDNRAVKMSHVVRLSHFVFSDTGILLVEEFLTTEEELELVSLIDETPWVDSQSGRRKQVCLTRISAAGSIL